MPLTVHRSSAAAYRTVSYTATISSATNVGQTVKSTISWVVIGPAFTHSTERFFSSTRLVNSTSSSSTSSTAHTWRTGAYVPGVGIVTGAQNGATGVSRATSLRTYTSTTTTQTIARNNTVTDVWTRTLTAHAGSSDGGGNPTTIAATVTVIETTSTTSGAPWTTTTFATGTYASLTWVGALYPGDPFGGQSMSLVHFDTIVHAASNERLFAITRTTTDGYGVATYMCAEVASLMLNPATYTQSTQWRGQTGLSSTRLVTFVTGETVVTTTGARYTVTRYTLDTAGSGPETALFIGNHTTTTHLTWTTVSTSSRSHSATAEMGRTLFTASLAQTYWASVLVHDSDLSVYATSIQSLRAFVSTFDMETTHYVSTLADTLHGMVSETRIVWDVPFVCELPVSDATKQQAVDYLGAKAATAAATSDTRALAFAVNGGTGEAFRVAPYVTALAVPSVTLGTEWKGQLVLGQWSAGLESITRFGGANEHASTRLGLAVFPHGFHRLSYVGSDGGVVSESFYVESGTVSHKFFRGSVMVHDRVLGARCVGSAGAMDTVRGVPTTAQMFLTASRHDTNF